MSSPRHSEAQTCRARKAQETAEALRGQFTDTQAELAQQRILTEQARQQASEQEQAAQEALQAAHELRRAKRRGAAYAAPGTAGGGGSDASSR